MRNHLQLGILIAIVIVSGQAQAQFDIEKPPFEYSKTKDSNAVSRLIASIQSGETELEHDEGNGYLRSLLKALKVPESSQSLVFSKTSMQVRYISPRNPRAVYFNDDVYVGWVRGSEIMEISTTDPKLGAAFYTATMTPQRAEFKQATYSCLGCHATTLTQGVPGHTVRSVSPRIDGSLDAATRSFVTDHSSPLTELWGGWYVTGRHGAMKHMGNTVLRGGRLDTEGNGNRLSLRNEFSTGDWLSPYSDIVALMVLEHQTQMHNTFTKANFLVRHAQYLFESIPNAELNSDARAERDATITEAAKDVVDYMLFVDEAKLTSEVKGSIQFKRDFLSRGPSDQQGRSLRDFNLKSRLFEFPCSYLIYSSAFDSLEESLRHAIYARLWEVLTSETPSHRYRHLNSATRAAILDILRDTKKGLPAEWLVHRSDRR